MVFQVLPFWVSSLRLTEFVVEPLKSTNAGSLRN